MTSSRWEEIATWLDELLDRPADERAASLEQIRAADAALAAEVERLLKADTAAGDFLDAPFDVVADLVAQAATASAEFAPGVTIDRYRILREVGRGGMGVVFLAERADGAFEQRVALKIVHADCCSELELHGLLQERRILAGLDHPNIAKLLDGGVTADGRPYFVMEYVEGLPLTRYCDDRQLDVDSRLRIFLDVCSAVALAHRHLVVHRDLKPSNILVTSDGRVKLLDFGIAKLIAPTEPRVAAHTLASAMTPEYAAPEQIRGTAVTTATDVYGLGMVLFELLTGIGPYKAASRLELPAATLTQEPLRPSAAVRERAKNGTATITMSAAALRRRLKGDLDTIVLMALRKEADRRYQSADALAQDLRHHLAHEPIVARRDSRTYRARRFVRRHALGVAAALLVAVSLVAGLIGTLWQARAASEQARRAEAAQRFLADVFRVSDPSELVGQTVTAREILNFATRRIEREISETPDVQADLLTVIGRIYTQLGLYRQASPLLQRALELRRSLSQADRADTAESLDALGVLQTRQGEFVAAEQSLSQALSMFRRTAGRESAGAATTLNHLADLQLQRAQFAAAETFASEALDLRKKLFGDRHTAVAESLVLLADIARGNGDLDRATSLDRDALEIRRARFGNDHPDVIQSLSHVGRDASLRGDQRAAEDIYREALASARKTLGPDHPDTLSLLSDLATVLTHEGKLLAGEIMLREALEARQLRVGTDHPSLLSNLRALAWTNNRLGRQSDAERFSRDALTIAERHYGAAHPETAQSLTDLGALLADHGWLAEAEVLLRRSLTIVRGLPPERPENERAIMILGGDTAFALGRALVLAHRPREAEPLLQEAAAVRTRVFGERHPATAEATLELKNVAGH